MFLMWVSQRQLVRPLSLPSPSPPPPPAAGRLPTSAPVRAPARRKRLAVVECVLALRRRLVSEVPRPYCKCKRAWELTRALWGDAERRGIAEIFIGGSQEQRRLCHFAACLVPPSRCKWGRTAGVAAARVLNDVAWSGTMLLFFFLFKPTFVISKFVHSHPIWHDREKRAEGSKKKKKKLQTDASLRIVLWSFWPDSTETFALYVLEKLVYFFIFELKKPNLASAWQLWQLRVSSPAYLHPHQTVSDQS